MPPYPILIIKIFLSKVLFQSLFPTTDLQRKQDYFR